jgi:SAM-dependent methyltransferase
MVSVKLSATLNGNVYSGQLRAKFSFLKGIAVRLGFAPTVLLLAQLVQAKAMNWCCGILERFLTHAVCCPCCRWTGLQFRTIFFGSYLRRNCGCPRCKSMERHRSYFLYYSGTTGFGDTKGKVIVYFAPEKSLADWLHNQKGLVVKADLVAPDVDLRADLGFLPFKSGSVDMIINHHVLEHVPDDSAALAEFDRILKSDGRLFISVPLDENRQFTWDWGFPDPVKQDHFRDYGMDFSQKLARFEFAAVDIPTAFSPEQVRRYGLGTSEIVFACRKHLGSENEM